MAEKRQILTVSEDIITDPSNLASIYDRYASSLFRYAYAITGSKEDAEDCVQNVFLQLAANPPRRVQNLKAFLFVSIRNAAFTVVNTRKRQKDLAATCQANPQSIETVPDAVTEAIGQLPPDQREVVILKTVEQMTFEEIGRILRISSNTAASRWRYAIDKLRTSLEGYIR